MGLDLAKHVFQADGIAGGGEIVLRRQRRRSGLLRFFGKLPPPLVRMEACASAHYWTRRLSALWHTARLMPSSQVKPYAKRGESDTIDAEATCETFRRNEIHGSGRSITPRRNVSTTHNVPCTLCVVILVRRL